VTESARVAFLDLRLREDGDAVRTAIARVTTRGWYILGPEVDAFESEFAAASGSQCAVGTGNGTDAISLLLRAAGIGPEDEVIVPAITAAYTALAVIAAGAKPVIVDVDEETLTMDPAACAAAITSRTRAIVPVHLYGQAADMSALTAVAARQNLAAAPRSRMTRQWRIVSSGCGTEVRPIAVCTPRRASTAGSTRCRQRFSARACRFSANGPIAAARSHSSTAVHSRPESVRSSSAIPATSITCFP
jgi:hypothetical protein